MTGARYHRQDPGLRALLLVQICFLTVTLGMTFFTARGAAMHGSSGGSLHIVVMFTAGGLVGLPASTSSWSASVLWCSPWVWECSATCTV